MNKNLFLAFGFTKRRSRYRGNERADDEDEKVHGVSDNVAIGTETVEVWTETETGGVVETAGCGGDVFLTGWSLERRIETPRLEKRPSGLMAKVGSRKQEGTLNPKESSLTPAIETETVGVWKEIKAGKIVERWVWSRSISHRWQQKATVGVRWWFLCL
ncbi:unnamed protein product [Microthlaspi erraticum]|uniref:Uncharacterized protein n=1 Tax=Microthlaspi erraticum TaxID=1685480 RepID=A0A6D2KLA3_9BRAS|nr:unnamed protein product [Microthlaspi erraticum]